MKNKFLFIVLFLIGICVNAQEPFRQGPYAKGTIVTSNGLLWVTDVDIKFAKALPSENQYWSLAGMAPEPAPVPVPTATNTIPGLLPTNTGAQNSDAIERFLNSLPLGATNSVYIPTGHYKFERSIIIDSKPVHLYGDNGTIFTELGTKLFFPKNVIGIQVLRISGNAQEGIIENLCLIGGGNDKEWMDGVMLRARVTMRNVYVKGFYNGIEGFGAMDSGSDISGSYIEKCFAAENTNDGFFLGRTDGSAITVIGCDARDNGRYGFNDDSFLGNAFISCMAHYNKGGDFFVRDWANARSTFISCYSEGGNVVSKLGPLSTVISGIWGTGYTIGEDQTLRTKSYIPQ